MKIERKFTKKGESPYKGITFKKVRSEIRNPDGSIIFELNNVEVPIKWSQVATDIIAQKYFRKKGIPKYIKKISEKNIPDWLSKSCADENKLKEIPQGERFHGESSSKQVFNRIAGTWTYWGWKGKYFDIEEDAKTFYDLHTSSVGSTGGGDGGGIYILDGDTLEGNFQFGQFILSCHVPQPPCTTGSN